MKKIYLIITMLLVWACSMQAHAQVLQADSLALVDFYNSTGGPSWTDQGNWLTGPVSTWANVTVTNDRVTKLTVFLNNMSGTIPASIGQLTELTEFRVQGDEANRVWVNIHGSIPAELWNCTKIKLLQIKFTNITGDIPAGIEKMTELGEINFQGTYLGCEIPEAVFNLPKLTKAYMHESNFTGKVPASLANATKLTRLYLHKNKLSGPLPYVNLTANAAKVEFTGNFFTFADLKPYYDVKAQLGALTNAYQYAKAPETIKVNAGQATNLDGKVANAEVYAWFKNEETIPVGMDETQSVTLNAIADEATYTCKAQSSFAPGSDIRTIYTVKLNLTELQRDSLALVDFYNATGGPSWTDQGNWLTGPVSTWANVTVTNDRVTKLTVYLNNMSGTIPASIGQLTELTEFRVQGDEANRVWVNIHGSIPAELWNCTKIKLLQIKFTNITGDIPAGIDKMTELGEINFQGTYLGCELPEAIFNLPKLTKAYLHESNFTGKVPASLSNATKLTRLYLHKNKLSGPLPYVNLTANNAKVELTGNFFTFADLKPYYDVKAQLGALTNAYQYAKAPETIKVNAGQATNLDGKVANAEVYAWFKNEETIPVGMDETQSATLNAIADEATYTCKAQSSFAPGSDIRTIYTVKLNLTELQRDSLALVDFYNATGGPSWTDQGNWLTGPVSTWANVTVTNDRVTKLTVFLNNMSGTIPASIGQLTELTEFRVQGDEANRVWVNIHGSIPAELWNCTKIKLLQIKFTNITGNIPAGIEKLTELGEINFQGTYLGSELPEAIFNLPKLTKAYLHESNFTGKVPASLANATKLTRLYLHKNKLSGPLPYVNLTANNAKVELTGNFFTFADLKPYYDVKAQLGALTNEYQWAQEAKDVTVATGAKAEFKASVSDGELYTWFKDNGTTPISTDEAFIITAVTATDQGTYTLKVQSSFAPGSDIRAIFHLNGGTAKPKFVSAATSTDGTIINAEFDFEVSATTATTEAFSVKVNNEMVAVSAVAAHATNKKAVVLTLANAIAHKSAIVTLAYTPGAFIGAAGGAVQAFGPSAVTNNVNTGITSMASEVKMFPNPATNILNIQSTSNISEIAVFDITGKEVLKRTNVNQNATIVSISELKQGIYMVAVKTYSNSFTRRITKQ
jgi:Leucine-rich repeat (LRR) protein